MAERLTDRTAVITGGSSGIGAATARLFVRHGARVVIADLSSQGVEDHINSEHGAERAKFITCDVSKEEQVKHLFRETVAWAGRLDILCNVAGVVVEGKYGLQARCHEMEVDDFDQAWRVNVRGTWLCSKYTLAQMLEQEPSAANRRGERTRGWIVNVGSISGVVGVPYTPVYTPSKHAVTGMTKQMALDYAEDRIHVNAVCPGYIKMPMAEFKLQEEGGEQMLASQHPWNVMGTAEDCADAVLFLASNEAAFITGASLMVDGGFVAR